MKSFPSLMILIGLMCGVSAQLINLQPPTDVPNLINLSHPLNIDVGNLHIAGLDFNLNLTIETVNSGPSIIVDGILNIGNASLPLQVLVTLGYLPLSDGKSFLSFIFPVHIDIIIGNQTLPLDIDLATIKNLLPNLPLLLPPDKINN